MHFLRVPGGGIVALERAQPGDVDAVTDQLCAQPTGEGPIDVSILFGGGGEAPRVEWGSLDDATWRMAVASRRGRIRYLSPLVRLRMLARGLAPLHAAAAEAGDRTLVLVGAAGSGKTSLLLALLESGWLLAAGEWLVLRSGWFEPADDRVDLRVRHLDALSRLKPTGQPTFRIRRRLARVPGLRRIDRFELTSSQLGVERTALGQMTRITQMLWSREANGVPVVRECGVDDVIDELVAGELSRYANLLALYRVDRREGGPAPLILDNLEAVLRDRLRGNLQDVSIQMVEHPAEMALPDLAALVGGA